ncbi:purine-nucleoside phosphorylase [Rhodothalassium salexigens]|uniref:purine-nucleoside phosphorylase n=1 Tax=Rhodothalassium salexigens TaxID=1086 RepID=UPI0019135449|nr:purine-nucleoside phosphorylase [Rhodothalassium salexigens]MBK5920460.1 purine-nucleoside phosphorylase [Rhodothalassium salexigens]
MTATTTTPATTNDDLSAAVDAVRRRHPGPFPKIALILGSGLGRFGEAMAVETSIPYGEIPGFPVSTVAGHDGRLLIGTVAGVPLVAMQGRMHLYEGYAAQRLAVAIRTFKLLGVETLVITNAAGSLHEDWGPGSLMLIADHINLSGHNPLIGPNDDALGPRFVDMTEAYDPALRATMKAAAADLGQTLHEGVYIQVAGPNFETSAEIRAFARLGADAVGMSTVPECLVARHCGMRVLGLSLVTNLAAGISPVALTHQETMDEAAKAYDGMRALMTEFLRRVGG